MLDEKDAEIEKLKIELEHEKQESDVMIESFRISSDMLLERLKDLESANFGGDRPQTAQVLGRIDQEKMHRPSIMDDMGPPQILNLENGDPELELEKEEEMEECSNCKEMVITKEIAKHTLQCIRSTVKCKICHETIQKDRKKEHLIDWRRPGKMIKAIEEDNDGDMLNMFNHGAKAEVFLDKSKKQKPLHLIAKHGSVR
mmetsp:Transcript_12662/g.11217  ORF Transcript_12662/g.11217 Transcript_12662/m.11217 type:complete len:200 (+) Transcript_12662:158-757(+)|eukprot:CAMPEP_0205800596 /NCGR_PEP_ID=MMETSP0205-20121125/2283_1 /ASSEMBLY_ACC=CAM_ASM_000278 /TAXON_ID=36767 /ORGANISM="Euplotes focardii, Strain TN1" /LENGTH=199 /DNA_ID=CAMNT_0053063899 /DNA_START=92 /DNA_END=691 /DNA_ORIENTATION=+